MSTENLELRLEGPVATIILNRPDVRNAISNAMIREIQEALQEIRDQDRLAGVVITGAGKAFSAGADLRELKDSLNRSVEHSRSASELFKHFLLDIYHFPKPVIAAINGPAIGGGCGLATVCDLLLASRTAVFGYAEVKIGFIPALVSVFLTRITGEKKARELLLTGRTFTADEAAQMGIVNQVVPPEQLLQSAQEMIELISQNSAQAVSQTKELLSQTAGLSLHGALNVAAAKNTLSRTSPEFEEGVGAFLERRHPTFGNNPADE
jgi:methylglutaconyl-CoA hydratase